MNAFAIAPLNDSRWDPFVASHPKATVFHTTGWLRALAETYGYGSCAITTSPPDDPLTDALPLCLVRSALTGRRFVSVPFADHSQILSASETAEQALVARAIKESQASRCRYLELRSLDELDVPGPREDAPGRSYEGLLHEIDLQPSIDEIFGRFNSSSTVRNIRRSEREKLRYEAGINDELLDCFYLLQVVTRRRHRLPPQPRAWFRNLLDHLDGAAKIHVAYQGDRPVAAIFTCAYGARYIYKYGASDPASMNLGGTHMLMWRAIQEAKEQGYACFDLGRTDPPHTGLATFKERWGAQARPLYYYRWPAPDEVDNGQESGLIRFAEPLLARLPDRILIKVGDLLYRHMG